MRSLRDLGPGQELECVGTRFSHWATVFLGEEVVGTLTGAPEGFTSADGSWTITTRRGFVRSTEIVTDSARNVEVARREGSYWGRRPFVFPGRQYLFERTSFWGTRYAFQRNDMPLLTFTLGQWAIWRKIRLVVTVEPGARSAGHDLPILVFLGCRMMLEEMSSTGG